MKPRLNQNLKNVKIGENFNPFLETVIQPSEASFSTVDSSWKKLAPFYPYFRIYYVTDGRATMYLKDRAIELEPGNMYFIPAFTIVGAACEKSMSHFWMHFNLDGKTGNYLTLVNPAPSVKATEGDRTVFELLVANINKTDSLSHPTACTGLAKYLFSRFLPEADVDLVNSDFAAVLKYIDEHINEDITNTQLANLMYLSPTYFSNLFTKTFGLSPKQYVIKQKLTIASKMLLESDKTVKQISYALGYNNEMYFNRLFHSYTDMAPGQYRSLMRKAKAHRPDNN